MQRPIFVAAWLAFTLANMAAALPVAADEFRLPPTALSQFFGSVRGGFIDRTTFLVDQVAWSMSNRADTVRLVTGEYLVSGCRIHDCPEKGAIIADPDGSIRVVALINFRCDPGCDGGDPRLTIFARTAEDGARYTATLRQWADEAQDRAWHDITSGGPPPPPEYREHILQTDIVIVPAAPQGDIPPSPRPRPGASVAPILADSWAARYFGNLHGGYVADNGYVADDVEDSLAVAAPLTLLGDGNRLVSGCKFEDCRDKAAVVVAPDGTPLAIGLINAHCSRTRCSAPGGEVRALRGLTVFVKADVDQPAVVPALEAWADRVYPPGDLPNALEAGTELVVVPPAVLPVVTGNVLQRALEAFFGQLQGAYPGGGLVRTQLGDVWSQYPSIEALDGDATLVDDRLAAIVLTAEGRVSAAAIISSRCGPPDGGCNYPYPDLTIFVHAGDRGSPAVAALEQWADSTLTPGDITHEFDPYRPQIVIVP